MIKGGLITHLNYFLGGIGFESIGNCLSPLMLQNLRSNIIYAIKIDNDFTSLFSFSGGQIESFSNPGFTSKVDVYYENGEYYIKSKSSTDYAVTIRKLIL